MKLLCLLVCLTTGIAAQTPSESQLLLNEVRQLRQDLAATSANVQRTQILLFRLQLQESALSRALQRVDQARAKLTGVQQRIKNGADQIRNFENELNTAQDPNQKARLSSVLAQLKKDAENWGPQQEQQAQGEVIDAESQLRAQQAKHDELEAALDKIDKQLSAQAARQ